MAHSGLRRAHRDRLRGLGFDTRFLHLEGARDTIAQRLAARPDHFMPASLLDSQFAALEPTDHEEDVMSLDLDQPLEYLLDLAEQALRTETAS